MSNTKKEYKTMGNVPISNAKGYHIVRVIDTFSNEIEGISIELYETFNEGEKVKNRMFIPMKECVEFIKTMCFALPEEKMNEIIERVSEV
jgi:hypothetical protein